MKTVKMLFVLLGVMLFAGAALAASDLSFKDDKLTGTVNGKPVTLEEGFHFGEALGGGTWVGLDEENAAKFGLKPSVLVFSPDGVLVARVEAEDADSCEVASVSPDGKVLALDYGMGPQRNWQFYSLPDGKELGEPVSYYAVGEKYFLWYGSDRALFHTYTDQNESRECGEDDGDCGAPSVALYNVKTHETKTLAEGTGECDYMITGLEGDTLKVGAFCMKKASDWKGAPAPEEPTKELVVDLSK